MEPWSRVVVSTQFIDPSPFFTAGKHLRHARDHFALLLDSLIGSTAPHRVNYDTRVRNTPMETSRDAARQALSETAERLRKLKVQDVDQEMILDAITPYPQTFKTSIGREVSWCSPYRRSLQYLNLSITQLWFGSLHAIHHWSMVSQSWFILAHIHHLLRFES
jgi:hypothetical protein